MYNTLQYVMPCNRKSCCMKKNPPPLPVKLFSEQASNLKAGSHGSRALSVIYAI